MIDVQKPVELRKQQLIDEIIALKYSVVQLHASSDGEALYKIIISGADESSAYF